MDAQESKNAAGPKRWVQVALVISLALNLIIAGLVAGAMSGHHRYAGHHQPQDARRALAPMGLHLYGRALGKDDRRALMSAAHARQREFGEGRAKLREHFSDFVMVLRAEPFSSEDMARVLEAQRAVAARQIRMGHELLVQRIMAMAPDARRAFARRLEGQLERLARPRPPQFEE